MDYPSLRAKTYLHVFCSGRKASSWRHNWEAPSSQAPQSAPLGCSAMTGMFKITEVALLI
jgi:hypothetical protein